jgi:Flp pilus assembly pilin Flp
MSVLRAFLHDEAGQGLVEYALIAVLVSVSAIAALTFLGSRSNNSLTHSANTVGNVLQRNEEGR